jgi:mannose-6-phosphate isomerase-like protein (cupin superfamily)/intein/homing endonuclease
MMIKELSFKGQDEHGNVFCLPLLDGDGFEKTAAAKSGNLHPRIKDFVRTVRPTKKGIYVLVNALGAAEYWGSNVNGDLFAEKALIHAPADWDTYSTEKMREVAKTWDYGFPTFMNACPFRHHSNKDPSKALGRVELSVWNSKMHRVELIVYLDRELCKKFDAYDLIERIERGEFPDVSMGCFRAGTLVTMADGTRKPIEQIIVGDRVLTHRGRARKVTQLHRRQYTGPLHTIKAEAHRALECTHQHPFLAVTQEHVKEKDDHSNWRWKKYLGGLFPQWVHAECLDDSSHYALAPVPEETGEDGSADEAKSRAQVRLVGYYLAEGHILHNKSGGLAGIELTTHREDPIHDEIEELCRVWGTANSPVTFDRQNSEASVGIWIFDKALADLCQTLAGRYSKTKKLAEEILGWPKKRLFDLIGAYANGDGCGPDDGSLKLSTSSEDLAWQLQLVISRLRVPASVSRLEHEATGFSTKPTTEWVVHIGKQWAGLFRPYTSKVKRSEVVKAKNSRVVGQGAGTNDTFVITPIREITARYAEVEVFNFEVEEDESYIVEGLAVHNCKVPFDVCTICENKSKTRHDYCEHALRMMNKILDDGRKVAVRNDYPKFFDISFVFIGADKTAKVMAKLAHKSNQVCMGSVCMAPALEKTAASTKQRALSALIASGVGFGSGVSGSVAADKLHKQKIDKKEALREGLGEAIGGLALGGAFPFTKKAFTINIEKATEENPNYRKVLHTAKREQLVAMSLPPGGDIGAETHPRTDQFIRVESGKGKSVLDGKETPLASGSATVVHSGTRHNIVNTGKKPLKIYTVYSKNEHPDKIVERTKADAQRMEKDANDPIKKKVEIQGVPIWLEWLKGETRLYKKGKVVKYERLMKADYGYIPETKDSDGEDIDVYLGPDRSSTMAYVIRQMKKSDGTFDEHKVMLGYPSEKAARDSYDYHMGGTKEFFGGIKPVPVSALRALFADNAPTEKKASRSCPCEKACTSSCCLVKDTEKYAHDLFGISREKSASHKKLSEIIKAIPAGPFSKETLPRLERTERDIPRDVLDLMGSLPLSSALSTPAMMGMILKPREFQRILLVSIGEGPRADELDHRNMIFKHTDDIDDSLQVGEKHVDGRLKELLSLMGLLRDRSAASHALHHRVSIHERKSAPQPETSEEPIMKKLAAAYNGYRRSLLKKANSIQQYMTTDPQLRADLFGESMAQAFAGGIDKVASASIFGPDSLAYLVGAYTDRDYHVSSKEVVASLALTGAVLEAA